MPRKTIWTEPIYDEKNEEEKINQSAGNVRVNLSIPRGLYDLLNEYAEENCLPSVPSACVQLIRLQLRAQNKQKAALDVFKYHSAKEIKQMKPNVIEGLQDMLTAPDYPDAPKK